MKKLSIALVVLLVSALLFAGGAAEKTNTYKIGVSKLLAHPALDSIEQGIKDYLATTDLNCDIHCENANGDISTCASIARLFKDENVDVAVGIATPTAQAIANALPNTLQVFATVTDPVSAGLTGEGCENICGVSDMVPVEAHLTLLMNITGCKRVGMIYTSGEANGIVLMEAAKTAAEKLGLEFVPVSIANSAEAKMAAQSIVGRIDAMYVATDNTVISAINGVAEVCAKEKVALFSADTTSSFNTEVLIAGGFDYYKSGILTAKLIEKVLKGTKPSEIGTQYLDTDSLEIYLNQDVADKIGVKLPEDLIKSAKYYVKGGQLETR
ncbi:MAG: ABC transporter substrate-binding protein [Sphaerochaetaceae bacterium]|nr:ABC transporter substrate-binding protein [Sphaerochaetaceae bacterium]